MLAIATALLGLVIADVFVGSATAVVLGVVLAAGATSVMTQLAEHYGWRARSLGVIATLLAMLKLKDTGPGRWVGERLADTAAAPAAVAGTVSTAMASIAVTTVIAVLTVVGSVTAVETVTGESVVSERKRTFFASTSAGPVGAASVEQREVAVTEPGKSAALTLDGVAGRRVSVTLSRRGDWTPYAQLVGPDGELNSNHTILQPDFIEPTLLRGPGPFRLILDPEGADTGSATVRVQIH